MGEWWILLAQSPEDDAPRTILEYSWREDGRLEVEVSSPGVIYSVGVALGSVRRARLEVSRAFPGWTVRAVRAWPPSRRYQQLTLAGR